MLSLDSHYKPLYVYAETQARHIDVPYQQITKRVFDVCLSLVICLFVLSWMVPLIGLLIKTGSKGPVLYIQKRKGYRGSWFYCFKFRTMRCEPITEFRQTTKDDCRVTPIGSFLRRTNLDEMPQFLNVLLGDMSVVGPRPGAQGPVLEHHARISPSLPGKTGYYRSGSGTRLPGRNKSRNENAASGTIRPLVQSQEICRVGYLDMLDDG